MIEDKKEKIRQEIEEFFTKYKISGICFTVKYGSFATYKSLSDKLLILDSARSELMKRDKILELEVQKDLMAISDNNVPSYTG